MGVKGLMMAPSRSATPSTTVAEACRIMDQSGLGALPVVEGGGIRGIFTYRDLVARVVLTKRDPERTALADVMTREVKSLRAEGSYGDALRSMVDHDYTYMPVVDEDGRFLGMLSLRSLLEHRVDHLASELDAVASFFAADGAGGD